MSEKAERTSPINARSERPATSRGDATVALVRELLNADRRMSVQLLGDTKHLEKCYSPDCERRVADGESVRKLVPKVLTGSEKQSSGCL